MVTYPNPERAWPSSAPSIDPLRSLSKCLKTYIKVQSQLRGTGEAQVSGAYSLPVLDVLPQA